MDGSKSSIIAEFQKEIVFLECVIAKFSACGGPTKEISIKTIQKHHKSPKFSSPLDLEANPQGGISPQISTPIENTVCGDLMQTKPINFTCQQISAGI